MRALAVIVAGVGLSFAQFGGDHNLPERVATPFELREIARLQAHFDAVLYELRTARTDRLSRSQQSARESIIEGLVEYRDRARFPHNDRFVAPTPYFRDAAGTLCAMAYLINRSGRGDIVERIASDTNNARINDLRNDRELAQWLDSAGISLAEAARVQPAYPRDEIGLDGNFAFASLLVDASALVSSGYNILAPSRANGWWGAVSGASAMLLGLPAFYADKHDGTLGRVNLAIGVATIALSVRGFRHRGRVDAPPAATSSRVGGPDVRVVPLILPVANRPALGVGMRMTF